MERKTGSVDPVFDEYRIILRFLIKLVYGNYSSGDSIPVCTCNKCFWQVRSASNGEMGAHLNGFRYTLNNTQTHNQPQTDGKTDDA